jgi:hypothetical protein
VSYFLGEFGLFDKRLMYEPAMRVPVLVRWPAAIEGRRVDDERGGSGRRMTRLQSLAAPVNGDEVLNAAKEEFLPNFGCARDAVFGWVPEDRISPGAPAFKNPARPRLGKP